MPLVETWFLAFLLKTSTHFPEDVDAGAVDVHIHTNILRPQLILHFDFLASQMGDAPYLCGQHLTAADIMMSTPSRLRLPNARSAKMTIRSWQTTCKGCIRDRRVREQGRESLRLTISVLGLTRW